VTGQAPASVHAPRPWPRPVAIALAVAIGVLAIALAAYASSGFFTRYWADDFCTGFVARERGLVAVVVEWYIDWTGSYSKEFFVGLVVLLGRWAVPLWAAMLGGAWLLALVWTGVQLNRLLLGRPFLPGAVLLAEVFLVGYLRLLPNRMESFYWIMGSVSYTLPFVLFTVLAGIVLERLARREAAGPARLVVCFALAFIAAGMTESYMAWQVGVLLVSVLGSRLPAARVRWPWLTRLLLAAFAGAAIGGLVVALAPGNLIRTSTLLDPALPLTEVIWRSVTEGMRFSVIRLANPTSLIVAGLAGYLAVVSSKSPAPSPRRLAMAAVIVGVLAVSFVVATYVPPYQALHAPPPHRSLTAAVVSLLAAAAAWGWLAGVFVRPFIVEGRFGAVPALVAASLAVAIGTSFVAATSVRFELQRQAALARFAAAWDARDQQLEAARGNATETVAVRPIPTFYLALAEPTTDPTAWPNTCLADFYGVGQVVEQ
jgi:hypothetical protein